MTPAVHVGSSKDAIIEARLAIMDILNAHAPEQVTITALQILESLCAVSNVSIRDCVFHGNANEEQQ